MDNITISFSQRSDGSDDLSSKRSKATLLRENHALNFQFLREGSLFDRSQQIENIKQALQRRLAPNSKPEMILIAGLPGTGKTVLARKLKHPVQEQGGYFVMGKFDQLKQSQPFAPLVAAMTEFIRLVLKQDNALVDEIASQVSLQVGNDIGVLTLLVPAVLELVGRPDEGSLFTLKSANAQDRLKGILVKFLKAACSSSHPLVLVMDDLQWADSGSLELLEAVVSDHDNHALAVVGTCRSNEVSYGHDLSVILRRLEDEQNVSINTIDVGCLSIQATNAMIASVLKSPESDCFGVTNIIYSKTKGNVFFTVEYLKALYVENVLKKDPTTRMWLWDDEIWAAKFEQADTILHLIIARIQKLPEGCQTFLLYAACLGTELDEDLLFQIFGDTLKVGVEEKSHLCDAVGPVSQVNLEDAIEQSVLKGIILKEPHSSTYRFCHDLVKEAAYNLVPKSELPRLHMSLGHFLSETFTRDELEDYIFVVVDQMCLGMECITSDREQTRLASLCLLAAKKAISSSDYKTSLNFLERGVAQLDLRQSWRDEYDMTLELYNSIAQATFRLGDFAGTDKAISIVMENARSFPDKINCVMLQMYSYEVRLRVKDVIELGLDTLEQLGEPIPKNAGTRHIVMELSKMKRTLKKRSDSSIAGLQDMTDQTKLSAMGVLNLLLTSSFIAMPKLFPLVTFKLLNLTLNHGASAVSSMACAGVGVIMATIGDIDTGYRLGQLALMFLGRYNAVRNEWIPRVYVWHYAMIVPSKEPIGPVLEKLEQAHQIGFDCGDFEMAIFGLSMRILFSWIAGYSLIDLEPKMKSALELMKARNQRLWYEVCHVSYEALLILMDRASDPSVTGGCLMAEENGSDKLEQVLQTANLEVGVYLCGVHMHKMVTAYHCGDLDLAFEMAKRSRNARVVFGRSLAGPFQVSYDAYICMALLRRGNFSPIRKLLLLRQVHSCLSYLKKSAASAPENYIHKILLIEGEMLAYRQKPAQAVAKYTRAREEACSHGFLDVVAIASEREALVRRDFGMADQMESYQRAIVCYELWGAYAKAARLKEALSKEKSKENSE
ncbi:unnamed protein product [Cylindrotheca closterium]|uniref:Orc1-like AAA ATPase domain-containing protein n=1 Tax=Cylindrotheca closterium TaxID=2856 RepID=A0AAD2FPE0_9STRA|nr:unnamed protein product [Cylindrotheca closterium]